LKITKGKSSTLRCASYSNGKRFALRPHKSSAIERSEDSTLYSREQARGQASMIDLVIGFSIFLLVFASVSAVINKNSKDFTKNSEINEIKHDSFFVLKELTETQGYPLDWETLNENDVERIGLAKRNEINEDKLMAFSNMTYNKSKELLKLQGYDYFFVLDGADYVTAGLNPASQTKYLIKTKRIVNYKGSEAEVELQVYTLWE